MNTPLRAAHDSQSPGADHPLSIDEMLVTSGRLKREDVARVQRQQEIANAGFGEAAVQLGLLSNDDVRQFQAREYRSAVNPQPIGELSPELVCAIEPGHPLAAAIFRIRTSLFLTHKGKAGPLMVAVVGAERGEGRTVLAANLAIAYAQVGARTVLIDGDMRHGRLHSLFGVANEGGFARALTGRVAFDEGMPVLMDHDLVLITAGSAPDRQQMLSPARLRTVMSRLALRADVVVVDTPAWSISADAQLIAAETGLALLVTRIGRGDKTNVKNLTDALAQSGTVTFAVPIS